MSSEQNMPETSFSQAPPSVQQGDSFSGSSNPGMGQSKSSRRRRRKRKAGDFGPEVSASPAAQPAQGGFAPSLQAQAPPQGGAPNGFQGGYQQTFAAPGNGFAGNRDSFNSNQGFRDNGFSNRDGGKRWKKKFRDRDRPRFSDNPGNQSFGNAPSQQPAQPRDTNTHQFGNRADFKRKVSKVSRGDRGTRGFVGPMDHSYRALHGAVEHSPSTIDVSLGWSRAVDSPVDYSQGRAVVIDENAPARVYIFTEDLFVVAKVNEMIRKLGVKVTFIKNDKDSIAELLALEDEARPHLVVFDLNNANAKPLTLIPKIKTKFKRHTSIIGFLSQVQADLKQKATEAGCDTVMTRSAFSQNLPNLLRRYGIEDEFEEGDFNY